MKNLTFMCAVLLCTAHAYAQVGIGTTSPEGALDITSSNSGVVVPRVALISKDSPDPIINPQSGLPADGTLVWNTATTGTGINRVFPGFYFWNGNQWNVLADGSGKDWSPYGNTDTDPSTNFIGTADENDLVFKTNNVQRMSINASVDPISGTAGDVVIGDPNSGTVKANRELVMRQDGDVSGSTVLRLRNRFGENGAVFETINASAYLVDFLFKTGPSATPYVSNIRFETRPGSKKMATNNTEFQFGKPDGTNGGPTLVVGADGNGSNSSFRIGRLGIGTVNPTAKLEIDATTENIPALEIVPRTTAPTGTANGQIAVIDNSMYMFDLGRNKWLSVETMPFAFGNSGSTNNSYLNFTTFANQNSSAKMPFDGTIVAITVQTSGGGSGATKGFEIRKNGTTASIFSFNLVAYAYMNTTTNIDFNAGDFINVFAVAGGGSPSDPVATLFINWRK